MRVAMPAKHHSVGALPLEHCLKLLHGHIAQHNGSPARGMDGGLVIERFLFYLRQLDT